MPQVSGQHVISAALHTGRWHKMQQFQAQLPYQPLPYLSETLILQHFDRVLTIAPPVSLLKVLHFWTTCAQ
ncbi:Uncharacterised protein [Actinomyces bovis]|uniref:Uncharacterized protein n=1 Tax=Actinomyces bovis TaxID=1658 RepID=A0ABY1VMV2_9ACTO|nr:Uncharacterised protein [Actinomyces bovis]VEG52329.1 Uncharacterised protein [Actinomyces israelii]